MSTYQCENRDVTIHALQTETVRVKKRHQTARFDGLTARFADVVLDRRYSEPLPVYIWVIEHPEGILVVDTGITNAVHEPGHFDVGNQWFLKHDSQFDVRKNQELGAGLRQLGIDPSDVRWVVLTHLHTDHTEGLRDVPSAEVLITKREYDFHQRVPIGSSVATWPDGLAIRLIDHQSQAFDLFKGWSLTDTGDIILVSTPGHTPGHQSVILTMDEHTILFAGDTSFDERQLLANECSGIVWDTEVTIETLSRIRQLAKNHNVVYLPTHDSAAADRLRTGATLRA